MQDRHGSGRLALRAWPAGRLDSAAMRRTLAAAVFVCASLLLPSNALGHAALVSADPADGSEVEGPFSGPITLVFSEALAQGSRADLSADNGSFGPAMAGPDPADPTRIVFGEFELVMPSTTYTIEWTSVADDGDILRGTITFTVTEPPPSTSPSLEPSATVAPSASPSPSPTPAATPEPAGGSDDSGAVLIPIVVALALVVGGAVWLMRRRPTS
jgi:copper resistance protein C